MNLLMALRLSLLVLYLGGTLYELSVVPETSTATEQSDPDETEVDPEYR